jgi:glycerol kinase
MKIERPINRETIAMGAAYLAGLAEGYWQNIDQLKQIAKIEKSFEPKMSAEKRTIALRGWSAAVKRTMGWTKEFN